MTLLETKRVQKLAATLTELIEVLTKEVEVRTALMIAELTETTASQIELEKEQEKQSQSKGMMQAPYGYCPLCWAIGIKRSRQLGMDECKAGHKYPSKDAIPMQVVIVDQLSKMANETKEASHVDTS